MDLKASTEQAKILAVELLISQTEATVMQKLESDEESLRWNTLFRVLSLDATLPYWRAMNIELCDEQQSFVQAAAKGASRKERNLPRQNDKVGEYISGMENIVNSFFSQIEVEIGEDGLVEVRDWSCEDFVGVSEDQAVEWYWMTGLIDLRNVYPSPVLEAGLDSARYRDLVGRIEKKIIKQVYKKRVADSINLRTDWDKEVYQNCLEEEGEIEKDFPDLTSVMPPKKLYMIVCVEMIMRNIFIRKFWADVVNDYSAQEIECLFKWYQKKFAKQLETYPYLRSMPRPPRIHASK